MNKLYVIVGPTCSKKSSLASNLNKKYGFEIVNCDIYKAYQISDFWVNQIDQEKIKSNQYHLYSFLDPNKKMNVSIYQELARKKITNLLNKKHVVLVGGSTLYMNAILFNEYNFNYQGKLKRPLKFTNYFSQTIFISLNWKRKELYENINLRVDKFLTYNLDTPKLIYQKYRNTLLAKAIGYKEWFPYFEGLKKKEEVVEEIKQNTRNYAKRQLTWYRQQYQINQLFEITNRTIKKTFKLIESYIEDGND